jgi:hypothetical protein
MHGRTTVNADTEALTTLEAETRKRGDCLSVLANAVKRKGIAVERVGKPRLGLGHSSDDRSGSGDDG